MGRNGRKKEEGKIADNPLSKNIAARLGYFNPNLGPKGIRARIEKISAEISKRFPGQSVSMQTIESWITPRSDDNTRSKRMPYFDSLDLFAQVMGIDDPWDLFVQEERINKPIAEYIAEHSEKYLNLEALTTERRNVIQLLSNVEDEYLKGVEAYLLASIKPEHRKGIILDLYKQLLNLLLDQDQNGPN